MNAPGISDSLIRFAPELALGVTVVAVLVADLLTKRHPRRTSLLTWLAVLGLVAAGGTLFLLPEGDSPLFSKVMALDGFALFFKGLFLAAALLGVLFGALSKEIARDRFGEYLLLLLCLTLGLNLLSSAQHLLMLYLALELVSLPSYVLAGFRWWDRRSSEAALKYVVYGGTASGVMLYGFSLLYGLTGTLHLDGLGSTLAAVAAGAQGPAAQLALLIAVLLSLAGFGYKVAAAPFHMWCPDVYEGAPTPFVAFLSVAPKAAGLAALLRFFVVGFGAPLPDAAGAVAAGAFPWPAVVGVLAAGTMTIGNLVAIAQSNVKRMLAYSSIAQAGYILMALPVGTEYAVTGGIFHILTHAFMKGGAFIAVATLATVAIGDRISDYKGLAKRSNFMAFSITILLFSLAGIPPLAGFASKVVLFSSPIMGTVAGSEWMVWLAVAGIINSAISLYYYARVVKYMYVDELDEGAPSERLKLPKGMAAAVAICVLAVIGIGVFPEYFIQLCQNAAQALFA